MAETDAARTWLAQGQRLAAQGSWAEAAALFSQVVARQPQSHAAQAALGEALLHLGQPAAALEHLHLAVGVQPDHAQTALILAEALRQTGQDMAALAQYRAIIASHSHLVAAHVGMGLLLLHQGAPVAGRAALMAVAACPTPDVAAQQASADALLRLGDLAAGFARRNAGQAPARPPGEWDGIQPLAGRILLLHADTGLGETLLYLRYVAMAARRGAHVVLTAAPAWLPLLAGTPGAAELGTPGALPLIELHTGFSRLPWLFATTAGRVPPPSPYLPAPASARTRWQDRLGPRRPGRRRIGLALGPTPAWLALLAVPGCDWHSFGTSWPAPVTNWDSAADTLDSLAGALAEMDLIIAADSAVAHLAGALGRPVWVALDAVADWCWGLEAGTPPWSPTARLFRRHGAAGGDCVAHSMAQALAQPCDTATPASASERYRLGQRHLAQGRVPEALALIGAALRDDPALAGSDEAHELPARGAQDFVVAHHGRAAHDGGDRPAGDVHAIERRPAAG